VAPLEKILPLPLAPRLIGD